MRIARHLRRHLAPLLLLVLVPLSSIHDWDAAGAKAVHLSSGCSDRRQVALTFDDGPNPPYTEQVLDILRAHDARATFFVAGEPASQHADLVREERDLGMAVGSHSYGHSEKLPLMGPDSFRADLERAGSVLEDTLGYRPGLYRPPYGKTSGVMLRALYLAGYVSIGWDIDSEDWRDTPADDIVQNVLSRAHPGAIVLLHDGGLGGGNPDRTATVAALPRVIEGLRNEGYELVTVPDLTGVPLAQDGSRVKGCSGS